MNTQNLLLWATFCFLATYVYLTSTTHGTHDEKHMLPTPTLSSKLLKMIDFQNILLDHTNNDCHLWEFSARGWALCKLVSGKTHSRKIIISKFHFQTNH